jgi:hypothetical protein
MKGPIKKHKSWKALNIKKPKMKKPKLSKPKEIGADMGSPGGPHTPGEKGTYK